MTFKKEFKNFQKIQKSFVSTKHCFTFNMYCKNHRYVDRGGLETITKDIQKKFIGVKKCILKNFRLMIQKQIEMKRKINAPCILCDAELYIQKIISHMCVFWCFIKIGILEIPKIISLLLKRSQNFRKNVSE